MVWFMGDGMHSERNLRGLLVNVGRLVCHCLTVAYLRLAMPVRILLGICLVGIFVAGCATGGSATHSSSVLLSWPASPTPNVTYHVFRCGNASPATAAANCVQSSPGNFTGIASVGMNVLSFTDSQVSSGQTYYYAVTAVDSNSVESALSGVSNAVSVP